MLQSLERHAVKMLHAVIKGTIFWSSETHHIFFFFTTVALHLSFSLQIFLFFFVTLFYSKPQQEHNVFFFILTKKTTRFFESTEFMSYTFKLTDARSDKNTTDQGVKTKK